GTNGTKGTIYNLEADLISYAGENISLRIVLDSNEKAFGPKRATLSNFRLLADEVTVQTYADWTDVVTGFIAISDLDELRLIVALPDTEIPNDPHHLQDWMDGAD